MSKIVNGSSLQPLSGKAPGQIVLLLHGYGANGADLIGLAPHWRSGLPDALFLAPNAPLALGMGSLGYQWWPLTTFTPQALAAGAAGAAAALNGFIDRKLAQYGLTEAQLAIVGFSQGTMMALHVGLRRKVQPAGILGYSGMLTGPHELAGQIVTRPPVLLIHGSADPVIPVAAMHLAKSELQQLGLEVETHVSHGVGHDVDPVGLRLGGAFVVKVLREAGKG
jgi:phospholipase/carboxylesterase